MTVYPEHPKMEPGNSFQVLKYACGRLQAILPAPWRVELTDSLLQRPKDLEVFVQLLRNGEPALRFLVALRRVVVRKDLPALRDQIEEKLVEDNMRTPLLVAKYLAPPVRSWLRDAGIAYMDATGNISIESSKPLIVLQNQGADADPWRGPGRPVGTLRGKPAAGLVRALVDFKPPMSVTELARRAGASIGATYRVVEFLEAEELISRETRGPITRVHWRGLVEKWSADYGFQRSNSVERRLEPRGLPSLLKKLADANDLEYAVTGSLAAEQFAPYAAPRLASIYVRDIQEFEERLNLRPVDAGANVLLASTSFESAFARTVIREGVRYAAPSQVAVDLLTGPGRNPVEGEALLNWMENNEGEWRG